MGREIIFEVREDDKTIWPEPGHDLFVCGRDDATSYIAQLVINKVNDILDSNEAMTVDNLPDDAYTLFLTCNDYNKYLGIKKQLQEYYGKDLIEIQKAKDTLEDLREARRHATHEDFFKFSDSMEATQEWIEDNNWSRARNMIDYLDKCYNKMLDLVNSDDNEDRDYVINKYRVAIVLSE